MKIISHRTVNIYKLCSIKNFRTICFFEWKALLFDKIGLVRLIFLESMFYILFFANSIARSNQSNFIENVPYLEFCFPGILCLQSLRIFTQIIYRSTLDRRWGLQSIKMITGTGYLGYLLAYGFIYSIMFILQGIILFPIAIWIGLFENNLLITNYFKAISVGFVSSFAWSNIAIMISFFFKTYSSRDMFISLTILPLTLLSPIFYSTDNSVYYVKILNYLNPLSYQVILLRKIMIEGISYLEILQCICIVSISFLLTLFTLKDAQYFQSEI
ncbi:MAG: hypothetical protein EOP34_01625 [Rickettsiales bacterium]|nr:MAG: hypothetical protein EOP34_01625 [Rickettsiales bacterium]